MATKVSLSVIIPAYNEEHHLKACLDALALQTDKPDEVIVVDNNSTDKTAQVARSYKFVRLLKEPRQGIAYARDCGFNAAKSQIIGRIDADTIVGPDWVSYIKAFYRQPGHRGQCLTGGCYFYNVRLPRFAGWWQGQIAFRVNRLLMGHYILYGSNMAIPRDVWREVRNEVCHDRDIHEDLDLAIHVHHRGHAINYHEPFKVGVKMRRVLSGRKELLDNLMWWPNTLRRHGRWTWVFGWLGAVLLYISWPVVVGAEYLARLFGRKPLEK